VSLNGIRSAPEQIHSAIAEYSSPLPAAHCRVTGPGREHGQSRHRVGRRGRDMCSAAEEGVTTRTGRPGMITDSAPANAPAIAFPGDRRPPEMTIRTAPRASRVLRTGGRYGCGARTRAARSTGGRTRGARYDPFPHHPGIAHGNNTDERGTRTVRPPGPGDGIPFAFRFPPRREGVGKGTEKNQEHAVENRHHDARFDPPAALPRDDPGHRIRIRSWVRDENR